MFHLPIFLLYSFYCCNRYRYYNWHYVIVVIQFHSHCTYNRTTLRFIHKKSVKQRLKSIVMLQFIHFFSYSFTILNATHFFDTMGQVWGNKYLTWNNEKCTCTGRLLSLYIRVVKKFVWNVFVWLSIIYLFFYLLTSYSGLGVEIYHCHPSISLVPCYCNFFVVIENKKTRYLFGLNCCRYTLILVRRVSCCCCYCGSIVQRTPFLFINV